MVNAKADARREDEKASPPLAQNKKPDAKGIDAKAANNTDKVNNTQQEQSSLHQIRSSFNDLVIYNEQGQPYLDVNRLVYKPKKNMQSFTVENCSSGSEQDVKICNVIDSQYGSEDMYPYTILRFEGSADPSWNGMMLMIFGTLNFTNVILGIYACLLGCCGVGNWTDYLPRSRWSPTGELLQEPPVLARSNLDKSDLIIPPSCCRQWWVRNIYCAHSAHLWAYPTVTDLQAHQLRQRISQWGCLPKMYGLCKNMVIMAGVGGLVACAIHFVFSVIKAICAVVQIQTISTLVRERKRIFRDKERENDYVDVIDEDEEDVYPSLSTIFDEEVSDSDMESHAKTLLPNPPKEEDIVRIKSRRHISRLTARMKNTHVERWLAAGHAFVEGNNYNSQQVSQIPPSKIHIYENLPRKKRTELTRQTELMKINEAMTAADDNYVETEMTKSKMLVDEGVSAKTYQTGVVETLKLLQMHHNKSGGS
ncbi:unnamed protein product [Orchesella dallaii]|uniref:Uncharacterized protein n=1 Tax=Orchesella dallaii TaxID=48710 RepID=A0ABP1RDY5_9HEXA